MKDEITIEKNKKDLAIGIIFISTGTTATLIESLGLQQYYIFVIIAFFISLLYCVYVFSYYKGKHTGEKQEHEKAQQFINQMRFNDMMNNQQNQKPYTYQ